MQISEKTQTLLWLIGIPIVIAIGFLAFAGNGTTIVLLIISVPNCGFILGSWYIYRVLATGRINTRSGPTLRKQDPLWYWFNFVLLAFLTVAALAALLLVDLSLMGFTP